MSIKYTWFLPFNTLDSWHQKEHCKFSLYELISADMFLLIVAIPLGWFLSIFVSNAHSKYKSRWALLQIKANNLLMLRWYPSVLWSDPASPWHPVRALAWMAPSVAIFCSFGTIWMPSLSFKAHPRFNDRLHASFWILLCTNVSSLIFKPGPLRENHDISFEFWALTQPLS